ncbi:MAG: hypothetical protein HFJ35_00070 [Clostridia bacterium]|nr:hypothetical protein [Clostridia bacterium]
MKNVIIFGCPRAGKTTSAKRLNEELKFSIISIDSIVTAFERIFPEMNIKHGGDIIEKAKKFAPFLYEYIERAIWEYTDRNFVLEGWHNLPDYFMPLINQENYVVICLGYPNADEKDLFNKIRKNDTEHDNTVNVTDEHLKNLIHESKISSELLKEQCQKWEIPFFETDKNREQVLNKVVKYIKKAIYN